MRPRSDGAFDALPMPLGAPGGLWAAAAALRAAAASVGAAPLARSGGQLPSLDGWTGEAAAQAASELGAFAHLEQALVDRLSRAAGVLTTYGDELDAAQRTIASLQASWTAALPADPLAPLPDCVLAAIAGTYGVVTADLQLSVGVAAHRLRSLAGEVVAEERPGRRGATTYGSADPPPSDKAVAAAVRAGLPLVSGEAARREAAQLAGLVMEDLSAVAVGDAEAADRASARLAAQARDPVVASELWVRLDPATTERLLEGLAESSSNGAAALVVVLGAALATAANPRYAAALDAATRSRLDAWREPWLAGLARSLDPAATRKPFGGLMAQGMLVAGARQARLSPGVRYAATVGVAMVTADRAARSAALPRPTAIVPGAGGSRVGVVAVDEPVLALAASLEHDAEAARTWLLAPLPGAGRQLVVDQLVAGRYRSMDVTAAAASVSAVARLVSTSGGNPVFRDGVALDAAFLTAVGSEALTTPEPEAFRAVLGRALPDVGTVLARHPAALSDALDDSAGAGVDEGLLPAVERLTRPDHAPGSWEAVLPDRSTTAALVGVLAFDGSEELPAAGAGGPRDPEAVPAVGRVLEALGDRLEGDLVAAVVGDRSGDGHAVEAAARRLGESVGFTLTSAGEGLARAAADQDERNGMLTRLVGLTADKITVPGAAGRVATPLLRSAVARFAAATLPTETTAAQRRATAAATDAAADAAYREVRALVSRAHPWAEAQSPEQWAGVRGTVRFWDDAGTPMPEAAMDTDQRRAFTAWRREVGLTVYDVAPVAVRVGLEAGVLAATRAAR